MPFDGITVSCMASELDALLRGGKIQSISRPEKDEAIFSIHVRGTTHRMAISVNPSAARVHITGMKKPNPPKPPNFCMFLRKHLLGGRILGAEAHGLERVITFRIENYGELGDLEQKCLVLELTGRTCNMLVLDSTGIILDAWKHAAPDIQCKRRIFPGESYLPPPSQDKISPDEFNWEILDSQPILPLHEELQTKLRGFSPVFCRELIHRAGILPDANRMELTHAMRTALEHALAEVANDLSRSCFSPCLVKKGDIPSDFHGMQLTLFPETHLAATLSQAVEEYTSSRETSRWLGSLKSDLSKIVKRNTDRCLRKVFIHEDTLRKSAGADHLRRNGELILAHLHLIPKGASFALLYDYDTGKEIRVELHPEKDPRVIAQEYFKKYRQSKTGADHARLQLQDTLEELTYLESLRESMEEAIELSDLEEIRTEMIKEKYLSQKHPPGKKPRSEATSPLRYLSSDGYEILAGKNNLQNDRLTFRLALPGDLWLHARNIPGSHVILRNNPGGGGVFPDRTVTEAAILAVWHSKARRSGLTPVDYTGVKHVHKPPGARPGQVTYERFRTAYVLPDHSLAETLRKERSDV